MPNELSNIPSSLSALDGFIAERESGYELKEGAEAKIIWADPSVAQQTDYALVYLHGFRASHPEGDPVHKTIAQTFGYNLYLNRLEEHGMNREYPLLNLTEQKLRKSARFAFEIGKRIGKKVILMGTSTGASLALYLAAQSGIRDHIHSLILYSPLISFYGFRGKLLTNPPVRKLLRLIPGNRYLIKSSQTTYAEDRVWNKNYALEGALALGSFVQKYMKRKLFRQIRQPTFIGYYYKNRKQQDKVVSVSAIKEMAGILKARTQNLTITNFPKAGNHVICSSLLSNSIPDVIDNTEQFLKPLVSQQTTETR